MSAYADTLNIAYAEAMRRVASEFPDDADVTFLLADAIMVLRPWRLWNRATGEPTQEESAIDILKISLFSILFCHSASQEYG